MKIVATHDGRFHSDDVFAVAILKLIYPDIKIIRTRKPEEFYKADFKVDIGRKYNPESGEFDHHQESFNKKRKNKIPYASAGLVWKHFGRKFTDSEKAFNYIDEKLMQPVDAMDSGIQIVLKGIIKEYRIGDVIDSFKPVWDEKNKNRDRAFGEAVKFAEALMKREIRYANSIEKAEKIMKEIIAKSKNKDYLVLEKDVPCQEYVIKNTNLKYVVQKNSSGTWSIWAVKTDISSFESRKPLPKKWADLEGEDLARVTGVKDAIFCHKDLFTAAAESKEGAIKLVQLALKEK